MPQAKRLIVASLSGNRDEVCKAIKEVDYYMKRNFNAYQSHAKKKLLILCPSP